MDYTERTVIVTGASSGIGRQTALDFARRGANLVVCARRAQQLGETTTACAKSGIDVEAIIGDLSERAFAESVVEQALTRFGRVDILVNNAGVEAGAKTYTMIDEDDWDYVLDTNLKSAGSRRSSTQSGSSRGSRAGATSSTSRRSPRSGRSRASSRTPFRRPRS